MRSNEGLSWVANLMQCACWYTEGMRDTSNTPSGRTVGLAGHYTLLKRLVRFELVQIPSANC